MGNAKLRSSQVVTTFGPGAMIDLPDKSVIVAGLESWKFDLGQIQQIIEPRLVAKLGVLLNRQNLTLRKPPAANEQGMGFMPSIVAWEFPEWFIVQDSVITSRGYRSRRLVHLDALENGKFRGEDKKAKSVVPIRFVRACRKGHVTNIDWKFFVHKGEVGCTREMYMEERGTSGDLDGVYVVCGCGTERPMSHAAKMELKALGSCHGPRPWLGPVASEGCGEPFRLLIRSASNAYFPQLMSVISIPDSQAPIDDDVRALWDDFLSDVESLEELVKIRRKPSVAIRLGTQSDADVMESIDRVRAGGKSSDRPVKLVEFEALAKAQEQLGSDVPDGDFFARALPRNEWAEAWMKGVSRVVLAHRLREVVAQVGFTRFEAAGPDTEGELDVNVERAPLSLDASWLPAVENRGEGIFLMFDTQIIDEWLQRPAVIARGKILLAGFDIWKKEHEGTKRDFPKLPYVMLHSLSHLLMTAISLECGYPASSLRERVYATPGAYGLLIYTGSSDAEGTLGGLVEAGRDIAQHMRRALSLGTLCSNDPVCAYHKPDSPDHQLLLGSACHGCLLVAETSCEQRNDFLDRSLVIPTVESADAAFFEAQA